MVVPRRKPSTGDGIGKPTALIYQAQLGTETAEAGKCV